MAQQQLDPFGNPIDPNSPEGTRNALTDQMSDPTTMTANMGFDEQHTGNVNTIQSPQTSFTNMANVTAPITGSAPLPQQNATADQPPLGTGAVGAPGTFPSGTAGAGTVGAPGTFTNAIQQGVQPGSIAGQANFTDPTTASELQRLSGTLSSNPNNPQQAIATFLNNPANATLKPALEANGTIGLANGTYLVPPGQGGNQSNTWQVVQRGNETGGSDSTQVNASIAGLTAPVDPMAGDIRSILLSQMQGDLGPVDANNPDIAPEISAYNNQSTRDEQTNRDSLAEQYYASGSTGGSGLDSGSFNTAKQQAAETSAGQRANFTGSAVFQEAQARRSQLSDLLKTATTYGLTSQAQQLQAEIAKIDASLQEQGLTQQNSQFGDSLGFSYANLLAQENRDALLAGLNG